MTAEARGLVSGLRTAFSRGTDGEEFLTLVSSCSRSMSEPTKLDKEQEQILYQQIREILVKFDSR